MGEPRRWHFKKSLKEESSMSRAESGRESGGESVSKEEGLARIQSKIG